VRCGKLVLLYAIALGVLEARNFHTMHSDANDLLSGLAYTSPGRELTLASGDLKDGS
jgi:hypothetical protein